MAQDTKDKEREAVLAAKYANGTITPEERSEFAELLEEAV